MTGRFENKIAFQFSLVTGLLIMVCAVAWISLSSSAANARRIEGAHAAIHELDEVLSLLNGVEAAQRGYLLTGREVYSETFEAGARTLDLDLAAMERNARERSDATDHSLATLRGAVSGVLVDLRVGLDVRRKKGVVNGSEAIDRAERPLDQVRASIRRVSAGLNISLNQLVAQASSEAHVGLIVSATGVALTLAMLGFAFHLIVRELAARQRVEADMSKLAAIIASSDDAVIGKTLDGIITSWNASAERLYGYTPAEAVGQPVSMLLPTSRSTWTDSLLDRVARGQHPGEVAIVMRRKDGSKIDVELRVSPIREASGKTVGVSTIARDVSARRKADALLREKTVALEAARERLAAAAEFASALNQASMIETYRETLACLARVSGAPLAALYDVVDDGVPVVRCAVGPDLMAMDSATLEGAGLPDSVAHSSTIQELVGPFNDAALRTRFGLGDAPLHTVVGWPVAFRGRTLGVLVTAHTAPIDSTQRGFISAALTQLAVRMDGYQIEQQRLRLLSDLQGQSHALEVARNEAERANRAKSEFLAAMSHELRTPMNSIMGFTARLLRKIGPTLGVRELDALQTVDRNAKHLLGLINDILDLSKIEAGKMETHPEIFDLSALARDAAGQSAALFDGKPVELALDLPREPVRVEADPKLIKQVVLNLLSNASKFTELGTVTITVSALRDPSLGDSVRLAVRDTGIGIRAQDRDLLFQRFTQLDGHSSRKAGGTGLGLALSERMVRIQGGRIDVESTAGRGSEFTVVLPRMMRPTRVEPWVESECEKGPIRPLGIAGRTPGGVSILCIDDEPDALKYLTLTFEDAGYRVFTASSHDEAVEGARLNRPDLVCLDLAMPGKSGFEFLRTLRDEPALSDVPILVVSATSDESRAMRAGARRYLAKPAEAGLLVDAVHELLGADPGDVLIVEDDPDSLRLAVNALTDCGLEVRTAVDGREAIRKIAESVPSAIVLDLMMPVMDGFAVLNRLGRDPHWCDIPVVVMTAKSLEPIEAQALGRSCVSVLAKGKGDAQRLVDAVLQAVRPRRRQPEAATV